MDASVQPEPASTENTAPQTKAPTPSATPPPTFESTFSDTESSLGNGDGTPFDGTSKSAGLSSTPSSPSTRAATSTSEGSSDGLDPANGLPAGQSQAPTMALPNDSVRQSLEMSAITNEPPPDNGEAVTSAILENGRSESPSAAPSTRGETDPSLDVPNTVNELTSIRSQAAKTVTADIDAPSIDSSTRIALMTVADESSSDGTTTLRPAVADTEQGLSPTTAPVATSSGEDSNLSFDASETRESGQAETTTALGGQSHPVSEITIGSKVTIFTQIGDLSAVIGSQTLSVGGPAATEAGRILSLTSASEGLGVVIASAVGHSFAESPAQGMATITASGSPYSASRVGSSAFVVGTQTVLPGNAVSVDSNVFSIKSGRLVVGSGSSAETLTVDENTATAQSELSVSLDVGRDPTESAIIIGGVTVLPDEMVTIGDHSVALSENNLVMASGTSTSTLALPSNAPFNGDQQLVIDAQTFTVSSAASEGVVIGGASVLPGSAVAVSGRTFSLSRDALVVASQGSATTAMLAPASSEPFAVTIGNQVFTAVYESIASAQSETLYSEVTTVMVARPTSSVSGGPADASQSATTRPNFGAIIMSGLGVAADASEQETQSEDRAEQAAETSLSLSSTGDSTSAPFRADSMPTSSPESGISKAETSEPPSASPSSEASSVREMSLRLMVAATLMFLAVAAF
ncbi:hypothetical protein KC336_g15392 [Hortaea werneckii]|nr:hypothetical protein KC336_g15392 [Hortaea werneckii]